MAEATGVSSTAPSPLPRSYPHASQLADEASAPVVPSSSCSMRPGPGMGMGSPGLFFTPLGVGAGLGGSHTNPPCPHPPTTELMAESVYGGDIQSIVTDH